MNIGFVYAIGAAVVWGLVYAIDQKVLIGIKPMTLVFINSILMAIMVLPFLFFSNGSIKQALLLDKNTWMLIIATTALAGLANFFIFSGIKNLDASTASIIEIMYPFFVVLFSFIIFKSSPNIYFFLGGALVFIGTAIIIKLA